MTPHLLWRRRLAALASGTLDPRARQAVRDHVARCSRCGGELAALEAVLTAVAADPLRQAEPTLSVEALAARVTARLDERARSTARRYRFAPLLPVAAAAAALVVALLARSPAPVPEPPLAPTRGAVPRIELDPAVLDRLERQLARERVARYLSEAQDLLVTVAATARSCERDERLDVSEQAERSRALLERRVLLVEEDLPAVASVRPVLEDVDLVLREVAVLPACARAPELGTIQQRIQDQRLLLKIPLMTRELVG